MNAEPLDKAVPEVIPLPEAPLSIHIDSYYKGFHVGTTIRMDDNTLIPTVRIMNLITEMSEKGFKPSWNEETNNTHAGGQTTATSDPTALGPCPKCGSPLVKAKTKDGTEFVKCSTNKWNKLKQTATGCSYVLWPERVEA